MAATVILATLLPHLISYGGSSGLSFLKLGTSGRGVAMADAAVAHAAGPEATFYNPAGIFPAFPGGSAEVMVMHKEWIEDTRTDFLGATIALDESNALGLSVNSTTVSDIEVRTRPGPADGVFTARNYSLGLSYARVFSENLRVGITGKLLYEKILVDEASGLGLDIGVQYDPPIGNLSIGAAIANLGGMSNLRNEATSLPSLLRLGGAYTLPLEDLRSDLLVAADYLQLFNEGNSYASFGGEFTYDRTVAARLGYTAGSEGRKLSTGIGLMYGMFSLDYAFAPLAEDLGNTHTVSVGVRF